MAHLWPGLSSCKHCRSSRVRSCNYDSILLMASPSPSPSPGGHPQRPTKWERSDKISLLAVMIALLGSIGGIGSPYLISWIKQHYAPYVTIRYPTDGARKPDNGFGAGGTAINIPAGSDLWLVVRAGVQGAWYPLTRLSIKDSHWKVLRVCPGACLQDIEIFLVPYASDAQLIAFVNGTGEVRKRGINSMPPNAVLEATSDVTVSAKYVCR